MQVTLSGIVMLVRLAHPKNADIPIQETLVLAQYQNAAYSRLVTLSGIVMLVSPALAPNAESPMLATG